MPNQADRHATGPSPWSPVGLCLLAGIVFAAAGLELVVQAGAALDGWRRRPPLSPLTLILELARGRVRWPASATLLAIAAGSVMLTVLIAVVAGRTRHPNSVRVDRASRLLASGRDLHPVSMRNARETAKRFGVKQPGLPVARAVAGGGMLYATWEDMQCDIWGPRKGKSTGRAIPTLLAAPGAAFATSNKPDLYAATCGERERSGRVWNFDPEGIAGGLPTWWWNPLGYATSDRRALELTDAFVGAYRDPEARPDPFFDPAGQELVAHLLRAAALGRRPITQAFLWSTQPNDDEPARILREHGLELELAWL